MGPRSFVLDATISSSVAPVCSYTCLHMLHHQVSERHVRYALAETEVVSMHVGDDLRFTSMVCFSKMVESVTSNVIFCNIFVQMVLFLYMSSACAPT